MTIDVNDPFMPVEDVATIFAVKPYTVRNWLKDGSLRGIKVNNQWRVQKSVVEAFAQAMYGEK